MVAGAWSKRWAWITGVLLLLGFFLPNQVPDSIRRGEFVMKNVWFTDQLSMADGFGETLTVLLPLIGGVIAVVCAVVLGRKARAVWLVVAGIVVWVLNFLFSAEVLFGLGGATDESLRGSFLFGFGMVVGTASLIVGNHVRKRHPRVYGAGVAAGLGALLLVGVFLFPFFPEQSGGPRSLLTAVFHPMLWRLSAIIGILLFTLLVYAVSGLRHWGKGASDAYFAYMSWLLRGLALLIPIAMFALLAQADAPSMWITFIKGLCALYGAMLLLVVGPCAAFDEKLRGSAPPTREEMAKTFA